MKGFFDTFSFLLDYSEIIFSKGYHWIILFLSVLFLIIVLGNGCNNDDLQPLRINKTFSNNQSYNDTILNISTDLNLTYGNDYNNTTNRQQVKNNSIG